MADSVAEALDAFDGFIKSFAATLDEVGVSFDSYIEEINDFLGFPAVPIRILPAIHLLLGEFPKADVPRMAGLVDSYFTRGEDVTTQLENLARRSEEIADLYQGTGSANEFSQAIGRLAEQYYSL